MATVGRYIAAVLAIFAIVVPFWYMFHWAEKKKYSELGKDYKFLQLVVQWGPGLCYVSGSCPVQASEEWTLHGLWPVMDMRNYPHDCAKKCSLNLGSMNGYMVDELKRNWPSFISKNTDKSFWKYEYCKHGTCCADLFPDPRLYFQQALILRDKVNLRKVLKKGRVVPTLETGYPLSEVRKALQDKLKVKSVRLSCGRKDGKQILTEVGLCFSKGMKLMDCPRGNSGSCTDSLVIHLIPSS